MSATGNGNPQSMPQRAQRLPPPRTTCRSGRCSRCASCAAPHAPSCPACTRSRWSARRRRRCRSASRAVLALAARGSSSRRRPSPRPTRRGPAPPRRRREQRRQQAVRGRPAAPPPSTPCDKGCRGWTGSRARSTSSRPPGRWRPGSSRTGARSRGSACPSLFRRRRQLVASPSHDTRLSRRERFREGSPNEWLNGKIAAQRLATLRRATDPSGPRQLYSPSARLAMNRMRQAGKCRRRRRSAPAGRSAPRATAAARRPAT